MLERIMNKNLASSTAPARTALGAAGESRPLDAAVAALVLLLGLLFRATPGSALACALLAQFAALLRAWFPTGPRAATPEQHARALRDLRRLHARHILPHPPPPRPRARPAPPRPAASRKNHPRPRRIRLPKQRNVITSLHSPLAPGPPHPICPVLVSPGRPEPR